MKKLEGRVAQPEKLSGMTKKQLSAAVKRFKKGDRIDITLTSGESEYGRVYDGLIRLGTFFFALSYYGKSAVEGAEPFLRSAKSPELIADIRRSAW